MKGVKGTAISEELASREKGRTIAINLEIGGRGKGEVEGSNSQVDCNLLTMERRMEGCEG